MQLRRLIPMGALCWLPACASTSQNAPSTATYPLYRMNAPDPAPPGSWPAPSNAQTPERLRAQPPSRHAAQWFPQGGRISPRWTTIVLHHSATGVGGARRFDKFHRESNGWEELGYHFVIGNGTDTPDGFIEVGSRWHKQKHGAHCKTPNNYYNDHGIGICLVGDFTKSSPTSRQIAATRDLVRFLSDACRIPAAKITTHGAVTQKTECPGRNFPLGGIRSAALGATSASRGLGR
jgi:hypothetical protein